MFAASPFVISATLSSTEIAGGGPSVGLCFFHRFKIISFCPSVAGASLHLAERRSLRTNALIDQKDERQKKRSPYPRAR